MEFLSRGDQSQTFPKFYFQTWGKGTGGQDVWNQFPNFAIFYGIPYQLSETFQTLPCLPINCLLNMYVLRLRLSLVNNSSSFLQIYEPQVQYQEITQPFHDVLTNQIGICKDFLIYLGLTINFRIFCSSLC